MDYEIYKNVVTVFAVNGSTTYRIYGKDAPYRIEKGNIIRKTDKKIIQWLRG